MSFPPSSPPPTPPGWRQAPDGSWHPASPTKSSNGCVTALAVLGGVVVLLVVAVVAIAALGSSSSKNASNPIAQPAGSTVTSGPAANPSSTVALPGHTRAEPAPVGVAVVAAKGWTVTVVGTEVNANATLAAANQFNKPDPGKQFMLVKISMQLDHTANPSRPLSDVKVSLLTPGGVGLDRSFAVGVPDEFDQMAQLQPGATIVGNLVYEVPVDQVQGALLLAEPQFTLDENEDQRFLALA